MLIVKIKLYKYLLTQEYLNNQLLQCLALFIQHVNRYYSDIKFNVIFNSFRRENGLAHGKPQSKL
jgi:hypothetical protein